MKLCWRSLLFVNLSSEVYLRHKIWHFLIITNRHLMHGKMFAVEKFAIITFREICIINGVKTLTDL